MLKCIGILYNVIWNNCDTLIRIRHYTDKRESDDTILPVVTTFLRAVEMVNMPAISDSLNKPLPICSLSTNVTLRRDAIQYFTRREYFEKIPSGRVRDSRSPCNLFRRRDRDLEISKNTLDVRSLYKTACPFIILQQNELITRTVLYCGR